MTATKKTERQYELENGDLITMSDWDEELFEDENGKRYYWEEDIDKNTIEVVYEEEEDDEEDYISENWEEEEISWYWSQR